MEPQKFFLGVIDFFAIILPGAILTFLVKDNLGPFLLSTHYYNLTGTPGWVAFLGGSYLLGHFIFLIGAGLLDDFVYDPLRKASYGEQISRLAQDKKLSLWVSRCFARIFLGKESDRAVNLAVRIKEHYIGPLDGKEAINAFQWSKARLMLTQPAAIESVHRLEADSKFFRSLVIVCGIVLATLAPFKVVEMRREFVYVSIPVLILAFWRYVDQRLKATTQSYWYILALEGLSDSKLRRQTSDVEPNTPTHAGGVVFRENGGKVEYLIVRAKSDDQEWILPKGHIEGGEDMERTAVREVHEEAGVWARVKEKLVVSHTTVKGKQVAIQFYVMESADGVLERVVSHIAFLLRRAIWWLDPKDRDRRERKWQLLEQAVADTKWTDSKALLRMADNEVTSLLELRRALHKKSLSLRSIREA